jgi:hypothetical protein
MVSQAQAMELIFCLMFTTTLTRVTYAQDAFSLSLIQPVSQRVG